MKVLLKKIHEKNHPRNEKRRRRKNIRKKKSEVRKRVENKVPPLQVIPHKCYKKLTSVSGDQLHPVNAKNNLPNCKQIIRKVNQ